MRFPEPFRHSLRRLCVLPIVAFAANAFAVDTIDVWVEPLTITSPVSTTTGHLDVYVTMDPATYAPNTYSYNTMFTVSGGSGFTIAGLSSATLNHPAAYDNADFMYISETGYVMGDAGPGFPQPSTVLNDGEGLFRFDYQIAANTVGTFNILFDPDQYLSQIMDSSNNQLAVTFHNATITILPAPVPEPASLALLGLGATGLLLRRRKTC